MACCIGSGAKNLKQTETYVIKRNEQDWYPNVIDDGTQCWRLSAKKSVYYHPKKNCIIMRNNSFKSFMVDFTSVENTEDIQHILIDLDVTMSSQPF